MNSFLKMLNLQLILFSYILVGIYCRKKNIFDRDIQAKLTVFFYGGHLAVYDFQFLPTGV